MKEGSEVNRKVNWNKEINVLRKEKREKKENKRSKLDEVKLKKVKKK